MKNGMRIVLGVAVLAIGLYGFSKVLNMQLEDLKQLERCKTANALVIQEFDSLLAQGKFPTDAQQETWKRLTAGCKD